MSQESSKKMSSGPKPVTNVHGVRFLGLKPNTPKSTRVTRSSVSEISEDVLEDVVPLQHIEPEGSHKKKRSKSTPKKKKGSVAKSSLEVPTVTIEDPENQGENVDDVIATVLNDVLETPLNPCEVDNIGPDVPTTEKEVDNVPISNLNADDGGDVEIDGGQPTQEEINPDPISATPASPDVTPPPSFELFDGNYVSPSPTGNTEEPAVEEEVHELVDVEGTKSDDYVLAKVLFEKKKKQRHSSTPSSKSKSSKTPKFHRSAQAHVSTKKKKNKEKKKAAVEDMTPQKKSVKRKRRDADESDVEPDVSDIDMTAKKRMSGRRVPVNVPEAPLDNISFHFVESASRWKYVFQRSVALERELVPEALGCQVVLDLIATAGLMKTVSGFSRCFDKLVKKFVMNITPECNMAGSAEYRKVYARGKPVNFSPILINFILGKSQVAHDIGDIFLNVITKEITAGQVKSWPKKGMLSTGNLSVNYALLNRIGAANWFPTNHSSHISTGLAKLVYLIGTKSPFDFGAFVFKQTMKHADTLAVKLPIAFPSLISEIILSQHPEIAA
ncbi:uncharacterized protein LOC130712747 [Lotus japonicus]|uniref:uncharacterized protein LOC130712747 n=1 Tax=Lotus japonicus TaxID=34305 RepID=UPI00258A3947|nr:uncharacterized protein LOC130712747 [Lotus japonicus]